jgi:predicted secreted Zn-dependent protease
LAPVNTVAQNEAMYEQNMVAAKICIGLGIALFVLAPGHAWAVDYTGPQITYYTVSGNADDVARQMREKGRAGHFAYTNYQIDYRFTSRPGPGGCAVASTRVSLRVSILMPRLVAGDAEVLRRWNAFEPALRRHEMGHAAIALTAAEEIELAPLDLPRQPTCPAVDLLAKKTADGILADVGNQDQSYDRQTNHGMAQGAVFP